MALTFVLVQHITRATITCINYSLPLPNVVPLLRCYLRLEDHFLSQGKTLNMSLKARLYIDGDIVLVNRQGLESDLFLLQCCAALSSPEFFVRIIQERFVLSNYSSLDLAEQNEKSFPLNAIRP